MVQMDLIEYIEARAAQAAPGPAGAAPALPSRRGLYDGATGRLYGVATILTPGAPTIGDLVRVTEDHDAVLDDARRFGG